MTCRHDWVPSDHADFDVCVVCGSYHSRVAPAPETIYTPDYWSHDRGHSTIQEQVHNVDVFKVNGITKNAFVLSHIEVADRQAVLEIGCAPGKLLGYLRDPWRFEKVVGIETESAFENDIRDIGNHKDLMIFGYFPGVTLRNWHCGNDSFSLIIGMDVFEHSHEPEEFLDECYRLLNYGGQVLLMLPLVNNGAQMEERFFEPIEHVFLHAKRNMEAMMKAAGFGDLKFDIWTGGHDLVSGRKNA